MRPIRLSREALKVLTPPWLYSLLLVGPAGFAGWSSRPGFPLKRDLRLVTSTPRTWVPTCPSSNRDGLPIGRPMGFPSIANGREWEFTTAANARAVGLAGPSLPSPLRTTSIGYSAGSVGVAKGMLPIGNSTQLSALSYGISRAPPIRVATRPQVGPEGCLKLPFAAAFRFPRAPQ